MASEPVRIRPPIRFGVDFELDVETYALRHAGRVLKLERIPTEILLFLVEQRGQLVGREQIVERIWGKGVFLDTDNSINSAIRKIRQALRDNPEQPRFIQTISGRGYRFIAPVVEQDRRSAEIREEGAEDRWAESSTSAVLPAVAQPKAVPARARWIWLTSIAVAIVVVAVMAAYLLSQKTRNRQATSERRVMLAVLPFANLTGDASQEYFSDGMTEEMITELGRQDPEHFRVIARTSVMHYKGTQTSLSQIGRELAVEYVIEGSVRRDADRVRITAQLIRVKDQTHVWARQYDRELAHLLITQGEVAQEIASEIEQALDRPAPQNKLRAATTSYEAYDLYLKGRYFWNKRTEPGFREAAEYFKQAIAKDPSLAQAYVGLADTYALMSTWGMVPQVEFMPRARAAALKALEIDPTLAQAHTSLGLIAEAYDYDWTGSEKEFRRAIELNPDYATAHQWYAEFLSWQGRSEEALAESERARQLDPLSVIIAADHAAILFRGRQFDRAAAQAQSALEMDPNFITGQSTLSFALVHQGKFTEALEVLDQAGTRDAAWTWVNKAYLYNRWGRTAEARRAQSRFEKNPPTMVSGQEVWSRLMVYAGTQRQDEVITLLQKACAEHSFNADVLKVDPRFDPLRGDPRFQELLRRLGLAEMKQ